MVIKIQDSADSSRIPLDYNEEKVSAGVATRIGTENIFAPEKEDIYAWFDDWERNPALHARAEHLGFHMTVNPAENEFLSDGKVLGLVAEIMDRMGYGTQPYVVYRHNDIGREHYHVVSTRVDRDGRMIRRSFENLRLQRVMRELGPRYGFVTGREKRVTSMPL